MTTSREGTNCDEADSGDLPEMIPFGRR